MRYITIIALFAGLMFSQCSPKVTAPAADTATTQVSEEFRSKAPAPGPAKKVQLGTYNSFELENGLKVIMVENHKLPRVSYQLSLDNDPLYEGEQAGYVQISGQMLNKGTSSKSKADIDAAIDFIGANLSTSSGGVFGSSLTKHQDKLLNIMTDVLYNPSFPEEEFNKIKTQMISGLAQSKNDPNTMASNLASILNYGKGHPYGEVMTEETVNNITLDKVKSYYNTYFKPNNAYLVIVGDITLEEAKANAKKYFGNWKRADVPVKEYDMPEEPEGRKVAFVNKDGAVQSVIRVTYPINLKPGAPDALKASVMNSILGGGIFSGRLMQNLREDKAYTYGARSSLSTDRLVGNFNAFASVRNEVTDSSVVEFLYEIERLRDEPVSAEDLKLVKSSMAGGFARSLESPQTIASFALNTFRYNLPQDYYASYLQRLENITIEDVTDAAKKFLRPDNAYIIVAGDKESTAGKLAKFASSGEVDFYDAFGKKIEAPAMEIPSDLTAETIVNDNISALGGEDKLKSVKTMKQVFSMDVMGQSADVTILKKDPKMMAMSVELAGMGVVMEQRFDGSKGMMSQMGQKQVVTEGPQFDAMMDQASMFGELEMLTNGSTMELKGVENVEGNDCYKVAITDKNGQESNAFYNVKTNLLERSVVKSDAGTQTFDFGDWKEVEGIMISHKLTISGGPMPQVMKLKSVELNLDLEDSAFAVE